MLKAQVDLELALAKDLNQFFQPSGDIVRVRKLIELAFDLLGLVEAKLAVRPHGCIVGIPVLVSADQKIDVVSEGPPDRGPLPVEH